jgi:hypothetical protein
MSHSLEARTKLSAREAARHAGLFERVLMFDFYDGPETGIAETADGEAYRFESIGESRHRRYRAYVVDHLTGSLPFRTTARADGFLTASEWKAIQEVGSSERYVAISDLWLRCLVADRLSEGDHPPTDFNAAHRFLGFKFASARWKRPSRYGASTGDGG